MDIFPLGFVWQTQNPYLFCVYHLDYFPVGNGHFGPKADLSGRDLGQDFQIKDGFRMYHGREVPGFPQHPHRGFETITVVEQGFVDHADSLGAAGRYGEGDVQWMTAGQGIQHSEMFPLLDQDQANTLELFQIWLNLPAQNKMTAPHFTMFWNEEIPRFESPDQLVRGKVIAGTFQGISALPPPPNSWAADAENGVGLTLLELRQGGEMTLEAATGSNLTLFVYAGTEVLVNDEVVKLRHGARVEADHLTISAPHHDAKMMLLTGKAIKEPIVQHGPFVMNSEGEIKQAFLDYQKNQFGGWPWESPAPVHGQRGRFARYPDGRENLPSEKRT